MVRDRRLAAGQTQDELAVLAGVSRRWLAGLEAGRAGAGIGHVLRTLAARDVELSAVDATTTGPGGVDLDDLHAGFDEDTR